MAGYSESYGSNRDMFFTKFNEFGKNEGYIIWDLNDIDQCNSIAFDSSENVYLGGSPEFCLVKFSRIKKYL